jgi:hypothetical protein
MKSFYSLISYDYNYLLDSIVSYYSIADEIFLGLDKNRLTFKKNKFEIDDVFFERLKEIDKQKKISIIEDDFCKYDNSMQNETYERNILSSKCNGKFVVAVDCDEIFLNANEFNNWLDSQHEDFCYDFLCTWHTVYKRFDYNLLICKPYEQAFLGTCHKKSYIKARSTKYRKVMSPLKVLHFSWGRSEYELRQKLSNWSHSEDFDIEKFILIWNSVTLQNYKEITNFHPLKIKKWWKNLELININNIKKD